MSSLPKTTLVLNVGSSSVKWAVARGQRIIARGVIDHLGKRARLERTTGQRVSRETAAIPNVLAAFRTIRRSLAARHVIPTVVAHRIVHGGKRFSKPTRLTAAAVSALRQLIPFAPLHQAANLAGVAFAKRAWPKAEHWGAFDTALFRRLPLHARTYALPHRLAAQLQIEKYGFHGLSHAAAFQQAAKSLGQMPRRFSAVTIHLGAGASMTAWQGGQPVETTMGATPLDGLVMATRSGSIDPAIPLLIQTQMRWSPERVRDLLERESGLLGLTGQSDMRDVLTAAGYRVRGWPRRRWPHVVRTRARLALDIYCARARLTLASYLGLLEPVQAIVFTGRVGESRTIQKLVLLGLPAARRVRRLTIRADEEQAIVASLRNQ